MFERPSPALVNVPNFDSNVIFIALGSAVLVLVAIQAWLSWHTASRIAQVLAELRQRQSDETGSAQLIQGEFSRSRMELADQLRDNREELNNGLQRFAELLGNQLAGLTQRNGESLDQMRSLIEQRLTTLQKDNAERLDQIRQTVDEKLHNTLEQRLGESFKLVSERLELVHRGLGEMHTLATGVGDLKKVLTNVKVRGIWGEVQLDQLLEQILTSEQYARNVALKPNAQERVDFAVRLPGHGDGLSPIWLPIDAKFPLEDYQNLLDAQETGDLSKLEAAGKSLESRVRTEARSIRDKYVEPPYTTDFGLLFLPIEGLYAEVLRRPGLSESIQRDYRVTLVGPTTLAAMLNSLQLGFRTLAIEKRTSEVWSLLGAVKSEFGKFGDVLAKTKKKLDEARNSIELAEVRTRQIGKKLTSVEELPEASTHPLLPQSEHEPFDPIDLSNSE